jgi:iron complex outermembrane receptor protein
MRIIQKLFLMVFVLSMCSTVFAVEGEEKTNVQTKEEAKMEEVVVTATRTEKEIESAPGDVHIVTKKDIEDRHINTVDEALNDVPGVFDRRGKGLMDTRADISVRGVPGANRTLIMQDGIPLNNAYTGDVMWAGLSPNNVKQIEVVEGPFSSLYGGNAMGGVVNIITKMPEKRTITLQSGYGTSWDRGEAMDDLRKVYLSYGDKFKDKFSLFLSYGYDATNGYATNFNVQSKQPPAGITGWSSTTSSKGDKRYLIGDTGDNRWWDDDITVKTGYDFSKTSKITASFTRTRYEYNYDGPHTYLKDASGNAVYSYGTVRESSFLSGNGGKDQNVYAITYETEVGSVKAKVDLGLVDQENSWYTTPGTSATLSSGPGKVSETPSKNYYSDMQFTFPLFNINILTLGASFKHGKANTEEHNLRNWKNETSQTTLTYTSGGEDYSYALFAQDEIIILNNLSAYVGFRQDWWETEGGYANQVGAAGYPKNYDSRSASSFSPKLAIVYKPFAATALRTSAGRAFRPPTVYELYRTWTSSTGVTYNGNPDLKPETTTSWDIGVEQGLWKGAKARATYFENHLEDLIYLKTVSSNRQDYINAGKATSKGVVAEIEQRIDTWLRLFTNATFTDAKIKENDASPASEGKRLTQMPKRIFNLGAEAEKGPFLCSLTGTYVSKRYSYDDNSDVVNNVYGSYDPYFSMDAKIAFKVTKFAMLSLSVDNILNRQYFYYYKAPGRSWFTELTMRF